MTTTIINCLKKRCCPNCHFLKDKWLGPGSPVWVDEVTRNNLWVQLIDGDPQAVTEHVRPKYGCYSSIWVNATRDELIKNRGKNSCFRHLMYGLQMSDAADQQRREADRRKEKRNRIIGLVTAMATIALLVLALQPSLARDIWRLLGHLVRYVLGK